MLYLGMTLLDQKVNGLRIGYSQAQAVHDDLLVNFARNKNFIIELEQQAQLPQLAQDYERAGVTDNLPPNSS